MRSIIFLIGATLMAQSRPDRSSRVMLGSIDFSGASFTKPFRVASTPSGSCTNAAEILLSGSSIWGCVGGTWVVVGGGGVGGVGTASAGQLLRNVSGSVAGIPLATSSGSTSTSEVPTMDVVQSAIDAKTIAGTGTADAYKLGGMSADGITARLNLYSMMPPMVFDNGGSTVSASCVVREALSGGVFTGVHLLSIDSATGADISGSVTVQFATSPATGSTTWTNIGTVALSSASRVADTTLSGWTATVATGQLVRACITGSPASVQKLIVSPRFF